ncbi:MAG TPA: heparinase II/III family protein, partial [Tepidisphaeraceae bacterium]
RAQHNWNLVCNGGVIVACLAVAEEEPALTKKVMAQALSSIRYGLSAYDAHGGTAEGPMYHSYATRYLTFAAAAMQSAAGDDRLLFAGHADRASYANWAAAGEYRLAMTGPLGKSANFGDSSETLGNTAWMFWHAAQFNDSDYARFQTAADRDDPSAFDLLWFDRDRRTSTRQAKRGTFKGPPYVFGSAVVLRDSVRGGKPDRLAPFLAIRTGSTDDHHSHLDLGHFVLDLQGERFAVDLGPDEYDLPGYLGSRRDDYLRSSTPGHNTLTSGNDSQPGDVEARTDMVKAENGGPAVRVNMTDAYPNARSVVRTATLDGDVATIVDDIRLSRPAKFVWHLHTPATVTPKRGGAILESNGQRVEMNVIEPKGAVLTAEPDKTRAPELPVENITHVRVSLPADTQTRVRVEFRPAAGR